MNVIIISRLSSKGVFNSPTQLPAAVSDDFKHWLVGFFEGDGCLFKAKCGRLKFQISQSTADVQVLHYIKNTLGFGKIYDSQGKKRTVSRYVVSNMRDLYTILTILNGNVVLPRRQKQFAAVLAAYNYNRKALKMKLPTINLLEESDPRKKPSLLKVLGLVGSRMRRDALLFGFPGLRMLLESGMRLAKKDLRIFRFYRAWKPCSGLVAQKKLILKQRIFGSTRSKV